MRRREPCGEVGEGRTRPREHGRASARRRPDEQPRREVPAWDSGKSGRRAVRVPRSSPRVRWLTLPTTRPTCRACGTSTCPVRSLPGHRERRGRIRFQRVRRHQRRLQEGVWSREMFVADEVVGVGTNGRRGDPGCFMLNRHVRACQRLAGRPRSGSSFGEGAHVVDCGLDRPHGQGEYSLDAHGPRGIR